MFRKKNFPESYIVNPLMTKLVRSRWLDIGLVLFFACLWTSTSFRSINLQIKNLDNIQPLDLTLGRPIFLVSEKKIIFYSTYLAHTILLVFVPTKSNAVYKNVTSFIPWSQRLSFILSFLFGNLRREALIEAPSPREKKASGQDR